MSQKIKTITEKGHKVDVYKGTGNHKYKVVIWSGNKHVTVQFGYKPMEQYKDSLAGLYSHKDHGDKERQRLYFARHGYSDNIYSAKYWANKYLW